MVYLGHNPNEGPPEILKSGTEYDYLAGLLEFLPGARGGRSHQALLEPFLGTSSVHLTDKWTNGDLQRAYHSSSAYILCKTSVTSSRRPFRTEKGYMGLAPSVAREGDLFCVLLGSSVPVLLRIVESHYVLVGECFVLGFMDGEALQDVDDGNAVLQEFEIH